MASYLDKLASAPPVPARVTVFGLDPGLRVLGWARIIISATKPMTAPPVFSGIEFGLLDNAMPKGSSDTECAQGMVEGINQHLRFRMQGCTTVVVEGQQVYFKEEDTRQEVVAKANDLVRLGQVTGAVQMLAEVMAVPTTLSPLPAAWKGQGNKDTMHQEAAKLIGVQKVQAYQLSTKGVPAPPYDGPLVIAQLPKRMNHGLDALCMAMIMGEQQLRRETA